MFGWLKTKAEGAFSKSTPLGAGSMNGYAQNNILVAKFTSTGVAMWSKSLGNIDGDDRGNAIAMDGAKIKIGEQFYRVVNPGVPVPAETVVIHRLRSEDVEAGEPCANALEDLCKFVAGAVLVGHFVHLDLQLLRKEMNATGNTLHNPAVDTAKVHQWLLRHGRYSEDLHIQLEKLDLAAVASHYGLEVHDAHHALDDAFLTARVWQVMMHRAQVQGICSLGELLKIAGG